MKDYGMAFGAKWNGYYDTSYQETAYINALAKEYFAKEDKLKENILTQEDFKAKKIFAHKV